MAEETTTSFKVDITQLKAQFQEAQRQIKLVNAEFANATAGMEDWSTSADGLTAKITQLTKNLDSEKAKLENLKQQYAQISAEQGTTSAAAMALATQINYQEARVTETERALQGYQSQLQDLQRGDATSFIEKITNGFANMGTNIKELVQGGISNLVSGLKNISSQAIETAKDGIATLANAIVDLATNALDVAINKLVEFGKSAVDTGSDFSSSMSKVCATMGITKDTVEDGVVPYEKLEEVARECGSTTQFSATDAAEALNYLALAGYDVDKACDALPQVLNIAAAGEMDLASASDMVTDSMSALGIEATTSNLTTFGDQLAKTAQKSNTSVSQLGEAILTIGGTAKSLAGGTTELNTALGILADNGTKGSEGGTALRNVILSLTAPTDTAKALIEELGVQIYDADGNMRPLNDTLNDFNKAMKNMTDEEKTNVISTIFNKNDLKSINALLDNSGDRWDELTGYIEDCDNACAEMAETMTDNLEGDLQTLNSALDDVKIELYEQLEPALRNTVQGFTNLIGKIDWNSLFTKIFEFKDNIVNVLTNYVIPIWEVLKEKVTNVITEIQAKLPLIKQKVEEIIPVVVAKFNEFKEKFVELKDDVIKAVQTYIVPIFEQLKESATQVFTSLKNAIKNSDEPLVSFKDVIQSIAQTALPLIRDAISKVVEVLGNLITWIIENKDTVISVLTGIGAGFLAFNVVSIIQNLITVLSALPAILAAINTVMVANPIGIIIALVVGLIAYFVQLYNKNVEFRDGCDILWAKIKEFAGKVKDKVVEIWNFLEELGAYLYDVVQKKKTQIVNGVQAVWDFFEGFGEYLYDWLHVQIPTFFKNCWESIKSTFSGVGNWFKNIFTTAWDNVKNVFSTWGEFFSGLWDRIKTTFSSLGTTISDALGGAVKAGINGVINSIESIVNNAIGLINGAIGLINAIPGVDVGYLDGLSLPRLAKGGVIEDPTVAQIGEDGKEAVIPLENNMGWLRILASQLADELGNGTNFNNSTSSNVTNNFYQTNNSPKSLSRLEIYRQSKNLLSFKGG